jgi:hypothetical protein
MASFQDADGRSWIIELDLTTADEIKAEKGVDLIDPEKLGETFVRLASGSTRLLVEVLWMLVHPQAEKLKVEPETFGRAMKPHAVRGAYAAIKEAIADFFLNPETGAAIRRTWEAAERVTADRLGEFTEEKIEQLLRERMSATSAGNAPGSLAI